jgi:hypothetical protein
VPSERRGLSAKKQILVQMLKPVNSRIEPLLAAEARERNTARLREALEPRRTIPVHHLDSSWAAGRGMQPEESPTDRTQVEPGRIGRVSQTVRDAQARRDDTRAQGSAWAKPGRGAPAAVRVPGLDEARPTHEGPCRNHWGHGNAQGGRGSLVLRPFANFRAGVQGCCAAVGAVPWAAQAMVDVRSAAPRPRPATAPASVGNINP